VRMPNPGSHSYDVKRTRLRAQYDDSGVPDQHADQAANEELQRENPPQTLGDPARAAGPSGGDGASRGHVDVALRSAAFSDHTLIPDRYSYERDNISPPIEWSALPDGTAELVLICEDPDAPTGTFSHWIVANISPDTTGFDEGSTPQAVTLGRNDFGDIGWGGPRPPVGDDPHRYFFRLYACDEPLGLTEGVTAEEVQEALDGHTLARGTLVGLFGR
jgi:Raf kinase inhibitor-like YbhB/YbcL family protein